jgi:putative transposase
MTSSLPIPRECLALEAGTSLGSGRVTVCSSGPIREHGRPENRLSYNGQASRRMLGWRRTRRSG